MRRLLLAAIAFLLISVAAHAQYMGNYTSEPVPPACTATAARNVH